MHTPIAIVALLLLPACSLNSTATHWNQRVGPDGVPVFIASTTNVAFNLAIALPFLGATTMDAMVDNTTEVIASKDGDHVRVIETSSENYWYGFPPLTWLFTPVITTLSIEYRPSEQERTAVGIEAQRANERFAARRGDDHDHVIPEPKR